jgi:hypothetical protein
MPTVIKNFGAKKKLKINFAFAILVFVSAFSIFAQAAPPDANLYYRRTHAGQLPPAGVNPADHSGETTNFFAASTNVEIRLIQPRALFNNISPTNLGKGDWIWEMPQTESHLGVSDVQSVINYETNLNMKWITVKCGDGANIWSQFTSDLITRAHAAGLKIFGWAYVYGNNTNHYGTGSTQSANINGEINVALNALSLGADGFIIDAETEYETNPTRRADATTYCTAIKANYPNYFLAHAPFPYISYHSGFPYLEFGTNCDAVMPQDYWGAIGISPQQMVSDMNSQWITWQNSLTGFNTNAIKPIVPLGQSYAPVTGAQITQFLYAMQTNSPKATPAGYYGVSFWDAQERTADMDAAVQGGSFNTNLPTLAILPLLQHVADFGSSITFTSIVSGTSPINYQWQFNGTNISGATTNSLTLTNAQMFNAGNYFLIVTNAAGSLTSSPASLIIYPLQTTIFSDNFDSNTATNWIINKSSSDTAVAFNFDYSALGISSAPHSSGGTTRGVQLKANLTQGVVSAISISPTNQIFAGDYRLHFDGWINVNGPFPGGGASSTEFLTAGIGTVGTRAEYTGNTSADGFYFSADGDGGVSGTSTTSGDYCAYIGNALQGTTTGIYPAATDVSARDNANTYYTTLFPNGLAAPALQKSTYSQQTGNLNSGTFGFAWHDVIISKRGSTVNWSVDGVLFATISNATFVSSNVFVGFWDPFASLTDNTNLSFGLVDNFRVEVAAVAPTISTNPQPQTVKLGTNITFNVSANGLPAPNFQWRFNGTNIFGATNFIFSLTNVTTTNVGNYSVVITNIAGSVTSAPAALALLPPAAAQFQSIQLQPDNSLQIIFSGDSGWTYTVEVSTNLFNWNALTNFSSSNGIFNFTINSTTNAPQQFYRARAGP